jgi:hypothetical protein
MSRCEDPGVANRCGHAPGYALTGITVGAGDPRPLLAVLRGQDRLLGPEHAWLDDAVCGETDPEVFYPGIGGSTRPAKNVCRRCPVRPECLADALANRADYGTGPVRHLGRHLPR